ncbi:MAG: hypothetical protein ACLU9S_22800 [Oscillospiraceae bacterium]
MIFDAVAVSVGRQLHRHVPVLAGSFPFRNPSARLQLKRKTPAANIMSTTMPTEASTYSVKRWVRASPYEDEDGLGLSLEVDGATFRLKDKKDNVKEFYNGYLTQIRDADSNAIYSRWQQQRV